MTDYSVTMSKTISNGRGDYIKVGSDCDGLGIVELRDRANNKFVMTKMEAVLVAQAILSMYDDTMPNPNPYGRIRSASQTEDPRRGGDTVLGGYRDR